MAFSIRQRILKWLYPLFVFAKKKAAKTNVISNEGKINAPVSFYSLSAQLNSGKPLSFETLRGRKVLLVNTASNCGFTAQYSELQKLYEHSKEELEIIAFPANDFKEQEKGSDEDIAAFCQVNYGVSFPITKKSTVVKSENQNAIFKWLSDKTLNGWNNQAPTWNFAKYLIDENGILTHYFEPAVSPLSTTVTNAVHS